MPGLDLESPLGQHFEKLVLLAGVLLMGVVFALFVVMREPHGGQHEEIDRLLEQVREKREQVALADVLSEEEKETLGLSGEPLTVERFREQLAAAGQDWPEQIDPISWLEVVERGSENGEKPPRLPPSHVLAVEDLEVGSGRGVTRTEVRQTVASLPERDLYDILWAGVVGKFDLTEQMDLNKEGRARMPIILITGVDVQRRERTTDGWSDWEDISRAMPESVRGDLPDAAPADPRDRKAVGAWYGVVNKTQLELRRPPFFELLAAEGQTAAEVTGPLQGVVQPTSYSEPEPDTAVASPAPGAPARPSPGPATGGWRPPGVEPATPVTPERPAFVVEREHEYATVWAHDLTVRPGRTYQYRMRVSIFNPVYGEEDVEQGEDRWRLQIQGRWSRPSPPIAISPLVEFFFVGSFGNRANLELHRWIHGQWVIVPSVPIAIGSPVAYERPGTTINIPGSGDTVRVPVDMSPGVVLVDLIRGFRYRPAGSAAPTTTSILVFADRRGHVDRRIEWEDQDAAANVKQQRVGGLP